MSDDLSRLIEATQAEAMEKVQAAHREMIQAILDAGLSLKDIDLVGDWGTVDVTPAEDGVPERMTMTYTVRAQLRRRKPERFPAGPHDHDRGEDDAL